MSVSDTDMAKIVTYRALNYEIGYIADELNISRNTVTRRLEKLRENDKYESDIEAILTTLAKGKVEELNDEQILDLLL